MFTIARMIKPAMGIHASSSAIAALAWWIVPILGVLGAIIYVIWVSKFKDSYENETHRSVGNFSAFQASFREKKDGKGLK